MFHTTQEEETVSRNLFSCGKVFSLCTGLLLGASIRKTDKPVLRALAIVGMVAAFVFAFMDAITAALCSAQEDELQPCHDHCGCHDHDDFLDVEDEIIEDFAQEDFEDAQNFF